MIGGAGKSPVVVAGSEIEPQESDGHRSRHRKHYRYGPERLEAGTGPRVEDQSADHHQQRRDQPFDGPIEEMGCRHPNQPHRCCNDHPNDWIAKPVRHTRASLGCAKSKVMLTAGRFHRISKSLNGPARVQARRKAESDSMTSIVEHLSSMKAWGNRR